MVMESNGTNLNTSYVEVKQAEKTELENFELFKYILC